MRMLRATLLLTPQNPVRQSVTGIWVFRLAEKRFADYFRNQRETGMGYWVTNAHLKDGRVFSQVIVNGGYVTQVRHHASIPFFETDIDRFEVTHDKWDWGKADQ
jgi:hypothetical protein